jgi:hypothetical protein
MGQTELVAPDLQDGLGLSSEKGTGVDKAQILPLPTTGRRKGEGRDLMIEEPSATLAPTICNPPKTGGR